MKSLPVLPVLTLGFVLSLSASAFAAETCSECCAEAAEAPATSTFKPAGGGKASRQHAEAKAAKLAADKAAAEKAEVRTEAIKAGKKPDAESEEPKKAWTHRAVRHKQTMPAAPSLDDSQAK